MRNTTIYNKNIEAMKERYGNVVDYIEKNKNEVNEYLASTIKKADVVMLSGKKVLTVTTDEMTFHLSSIFAKDDLYKLWFDSLNPSWDLDTKFCMYGLGDGNFARTFLKYARKDCAIAVHEPSVSILIAALENFDLTDLFADNRFRLIFWPMHEKNTIKKYYYDEVLGYTDVNTFCVSFHVNYPRIMPDDLKMYVDGMEDVSIFIKTNQRVHDRFGNDYNFNSFNNFKFFRDSYSIEDIKDNMPENIPAIIVAAGPSLDKNIAELKNAEGKALIIATDTALRPLAKAGIRPNLAIILDGKKDDKYLSEPESRKVPMICTLKSGGSFLNLHEGKKYFIDAFCAHIDIFCKEINKKFVDIPTGGSVANAAFSVAYYLGCKTIILVGQDLAYTGDKTHSNVTVRGEVPTAVEDLENVEWCQDIYGNTVRSSSEFRLYREWFEEMIVQHEDMEVIDATEGGARIAGTALMTLKDTICEKCTKEVDIDTIINAAGLYFTEEEKEKYCDYILAIPGELRRIKKIVKETLADYSVMKRLVQTDKYHSAEMKKLYKKCKDNTDRIDSIGVMEYVINQLQEKTTHLYDEVNKLENNEKEELLSVCNIGIKHLQDIEGAIDEMDKYMQVIQADFGK